MSLVPGAEIDGFRIVERIHAGGLGVVYAVERVGGPQELFPLLMKVPKLGPGEAGETVVTYEVERMVLSALQGPHVPQFVAAGDIAAQPYLVMERVEGRSLASEKVPLPADEVARLGAATADALQDIHRQGALHLDVKPTNVLVRPDGQAVFIDFGLSHHLHYPDLLAEEVSRPVGSAPYISPEQVHGVRNEPRSDIFSLGATLYELATGELPYGIPATESGLRQRSWMDPPPPRSLVKELPEWLQEVILRCLEVEPENRYATAAQVAFDLTHPDQVAVTERGRRLRSAGMARRFVRMLRAGRHGPATVSVSAPRDAAGRIVMAAVATQHTNDQRSEALRTELRRLVRPGDDGRLACVAIIRPGAEMGPGDVEASPTNQRIKHLVILRHWSESLGLPPAQLTHHVIESTEPAEALLEYARRNHVDHIVIGAPPRHASLGGLFETVASRVTAEAPCTVTVVRPRS